MLPVKIQDYWTSGSEEEDLKNNIPYYEGGGHLGHLTRTIYFIIIWKAQGVQQ